MVSLYHFISCFYKYSERGSIDFIRLPRRAHGTVKRSRYKIFPSLDLYTMVDLCISYISMLRTAHLTIFWLLLSFGYWRGNSKLRQKPWGDNEVQCIKSPTGFFLLFPMSSVIGVLRSPLTQLNGDLRLDVEAKFQPIGPYSHYLMKAHSIAVTGLAGSLG